MWHEKLKYAVKIRFECSLLAVQFGPQAYFTRKLTQSKFLVNQPRTSGSTKQILFFEGGEITLP